MSSGERKSSMLGEWFSLLVDMLFVPTCACCGGSLERGEHTICVTCRYDMPITNFAERATNAMVDLMAARIDFESASALMYFRIGGDYQKLIHRMKYGGRDDIARVLGEIYGQILSRSELYREIEVVVPVPLHWSKRMQRGYNQSAEFARGIACALGVAYECRAVRRVRRTKTQARMNDSKKRVKNVDGAFRVVRPELIENRVVLLVDDVVTTGATLEACAEAINRRLPCVKLNLGAIAFVGS